MSLNTTQKKDLVTFKETGELGSLSNILIEDCFEEFRSNEEARQRFNSQIPAQNANARVSKHSSTIKFGYQDSWTSHTYDELTPVYKFYNLQTLLSRTPEGEAVMGFLEDWTAEYYIYLEEIEHRDYMGHYKGDKIIKEPSIKTLDHLLYREFTEAQRIGKTFDEALEIITKIYVNEIYV